MLHLYKYHDLDLYFWLSSEEAESYNTFCNPRFKTPYTKSLTWKELETITFDVVRKIQRRTVSDYLKGHDIKIDPSVPLTKVH